MTRCGHGVLALVCSAMAMPAQASPEVVALQLPKTVRLTGLLDVDVDSDGRLDLVLACFDEQTKKRELRTHLRSARAPEFAGEPSLTPYALERDVIAFTFADVDSRPGRELVLFTAERAVAVLSAVDGPAYAPLFTHRLLWAVPDPARVLALGDVVHDVDGDGRDDFLLPEVDGARLVLQRPGDGKTDFAPGVLWQLPAQRSRFQNAAGTGGPARLGSELNLRLGLLDDGSETGGGRPLVQLRAHAPRFQLLDFAGDGVRKALALRNDIVWCWIGTGAAAATSMALPLPEDRLVLFDPAFDVQLADVDGDGRADLLLTTSARRNDEVEVRIDLFLQRNAGTWDTKPDCRLRVQTLAKSPQLVDADGDGRLDLVAITVRTDLLRGLTGGGEPTSLQAQLNVFRGGASGFQVPAVLNQQLQLPVPKGQSPFLRVLAGPAGTAGALLLRTEDRIALQPLQREDSSLRLMPPRWSIPIEPTASPRLARNAQEVLVVDKHELLHVSWR